jgi:hypothetical protein
MEALLEELMDIVSSIDYARGGWGCYVHSRCHPVCCTQAAQHG